jgi:hypothetical protein
MNKRYTSFVDTSYRRMLCDYNGHVLRPMTKEEERKWNDNIPPVGYIELSDEEIEEGDKKIGDW